MVKGFPETEQINIGARGRMFWREARLKAGEGQRKQMAHSGNVSQGWWEGEGALLREQGPIS